MVIRDEKLEKAKEMIRKSKAKREELARMAQSEIVLEKQPLMVEDDDDDTAESLHKGRAAGQREARAAAAAAAAAACRPAAAPPACRGKPVQLNLRVNGGSKHGPHAIQAYLREPAAALRDALAAHIEVDPSAVLKLELDGERLDFGKTLESFDLEDGDLIDATVDDSMPAPSHGEASSGSASVAASCAQHVSPDEPARKIVVHVDCDGATKKFRVLDTDPLSKLFSGAATALHLSPEAQFYFGERVLLGSATSRSAGLVDRSVIVCKQ